MQLPEYNVEGKEVGKVEVPDEIFAAEVKKALLWEQTKAQRASGRRGTHKTKKRGEIRGGGAKPFRQKGTGRARQGSSRSPILVGGGTVFGPQPRDYSYRLPKSARKSALRSALSQRASEQNVIVLQGYDEKPSTKTIAGFLDAIGSQNALFVVDPSEDSLALSVRNLSRSNWKAAPTINVYDVLKHEKLVLSKKSLEAVTAKAQAKA